MRAIYSSILHFFFNLIITNGTIPHNQKLKKMNEWTISFVSEKSSMLRQLPTNSQKTFFIYIQY